MIKRCQRDIELQLGLCPILVCRFDTIARVSPTEVERNAMQSQDPGRFSNHEIPGLRDFIPFSCSRVSEQQQ